MTDTCFTLNQQVPGILEGVSDVLKSYGNLSQLSVEFLPIQIAAVGVFVTLVLLAYVYRQNKIGMYMLIGIVGILAAILITTLLTHLKY